jgi:hypothetical protein
MKSNSDITLLTMTIALINENKFYPERGDNGKVYRSTLTGQETFAPFIKILLDLAMLRPILFGAILQFVLSTDISAWFKGTSNPVSDNRTVRLKT